MRRSRHWLVYVTFAAVGIAASAVTFAPPLAAQEKPGGNQVKPAGIKVEKVRDDKKPGKKPAVKPDSAKSGGGMTKAREAAALAFVREHHPELESLLKNLKERQPKQYEAAIRDLFRHSERLASAQENDAARYELELKAWKLQSRVQLLSAILLMSPQDEPTQAKLKDVLVEQLKSRREILRLDRDLAVKRLEKLDQQIEKFEREIEPTAQRQLQAILDGARPKGKNTKNTSITPDDKRGAP